MMSSSYVLGLLKIFYAEEWDVALPEVDRLRAAALANDAVRTEDGADGAAAAKPMAQANARKTPARQNPIPLKPAKGGKAKGKKAVAAVLTKGAKKVTSKDTKEYAKKRTAASKASGTTPPPPTAATPTTATGSTTVAPLQLLLRSPWLWPRRALSNLMPSSKTTRSSRTITTTTRQWRISRRMRKRVACSPLSRSCSPRSSTHRISTLLLLTTSTCRHGERMRTNVRHRARRGHSPSTSTLPTAHCGSKCTTPSRTCTRTSCSTGQATETTMPSWRRATTASRGSAIAASCEGGRNGGTWTRKIRVAEKVVGKKTGKFVAKVITRKANEGQAAQTQKLELIAQLCEAGRKATSEMLSAKVLETKLEEKALREVNRNSLLAKVEEEKVKRRLV